MLVVMLISALLLQHIYSFSTIHASSGSSQIVIPSGPVMDHITGILQVSTARPDLICSMEIVHAETIT